MPDTIALMRQDDQKKQITEDNSIKSSPPLGNLEEVLAHAQPRLARLAHMQGVATDAIDDVVQETLVEAWRHIDRLYTSEHFDAWLNSICRNICLRWARTHATTVRKQVNFSDLQGPQHETEPGLATDIPDPFAIDPAEELNRQDLAVLLDRVMGYLSPTTREALEMHYFTEVPQSEVALQLGLTINALEVRLHRARRQLRQVLGNQLRNDAEAFGMVLDEEMARGWRKTSIWCISCGHHQMLGIFEPLPDGNMNLRMRCPSCSLPDDFDIVNTGGFVQLGGLRSFHPAIKRAMVEAPQFYKQALTQQYVLCPTCGTRAKIRGVEQYTISFPFLRRFYMIIECPNDGISASGIISACLYHPLVQQFLGQHPRCIFDSEQLIERNGQEVIQMQLVDVTSASRLTMFIQPQALEILDIYVK